MTDLFISDLHLSPERPHITRAFFDFLDGKAKTADRLFILGDLTEVWVGDDDPSPFARRIVGGLRALTDSGTQVLYQRGNRDFLVGEGFAKETGATILPPYQVLAYGDVRALVCHGDTLCTDDREYQRFRRLLRNPLGVGILHRMSLPKRQRIADRLRAKSIESNSNKPANIMDVNDATVNAVMTRYRADVLIHGHTHRPGDHGPAPRRRLVLGDWDTEGWYIEADNGGFTLVSFAISR